MKVLLFAIALVMAANTAFAHEEATTKKVKHDKEHQHAEGAADHDHDDAHHKDHDHKAHHPEHKDEDVKKKKQ